MIYSQINTSKDGVLKEILYGVGEVDGELSYVLDQLSDASIEISADSTDITDKKGKYCSFMQ